MLRPLLRLSVHLLLAAPTQAFEAKGVRKMYPWQAAALECGEVGPVQGKHALLRSQADSRAAAEHY